MRRRETHGHEQIGALFLLRSDRIVGDAISLLHSETDGALGAHVAVFVDVAPDVVRIHRVAAHPDRIGHRLRAVAVPLRHHERPVQPPRLAHVELVRPMAGVGELILRQAPVLHRRAEFLGHPRIGRHEPDQALLPADMLADDPITRRVVGVGIIVVSPDEVEPYRVLVVRITLPVRHDHDRRRAHQIVAENGMLDVAAVGKLGQHPIAVQIARDQFELRGIVICRLGERDPVRRLVRQAEPVAIRLHATVALALGAGAAGMHAEDQAARGIARTHIGIDRAPKVVRRRHRLPAPQQIGLVAIVGLTKRRVGFAPDEIAHARLRHHVALVGRIDEHAPAKTPTRLHHDRLDRRAALHHARFQVEALAAHHLDLRLAHEVVVDLLRDMRLEVEHHVILGIVLVALKILGPAIFPRGRIRVVLLHPPVEFPRKPADRILLADVRGAEPAARQPPEVAARFDQHDFLAVARRRHRGGHSAGGAAVNDHVVGRVDGGPHVR